MTAKTVMSKNHQIINDVMDLLEDENRKSLALAMSLASQLQPVDRRNHSDTDDLAAWALAEILEERLASVSHLKSVRRMLEDTHA